MKKKNIKFKILKPFLPYYPERIYKNMIISKMRYFSQQTLKFYLAYTKDSGLINKKQKIFTKNENLHF